MTHEPRSIVLAIKMMFLVPSLGTSVTETTLDDIRKHVVGWMLNPETDPADVKQFRIKVNKLIDKLPAKSAEQKTYLATELTHILKICKEYVKQAKKKYKKK
jgi:hypothetical protein